MPYKRIGRKIYHQKGGMWKLKQTAKNIPNAKTTLRMLEGFEHGWSPRKGLANANAATRHRVSSKGGMASRRRRRW